MIAALTRRSAPPSPRDPPRWRRVVGTALMATAVLLLGLTAAWWLDPNGYTLLAPFAWVPVTGAIAGVLLVVGGVLRPLHWTLDLAAISAGVVGLGLALPLSYGWSSWSLHPVMTAAAPGSGVEARVHTARDVIDPLWSVRVHSGHGLTARDTEVACLDGDSDDDALADGLLGVHWTAPDALEIRSVSGQTWRVPVDAVSGRVLTDDVVGTC